jgi:hypothetical protein
MLPSALRVRDSRIDFYLLRSRDATVTRKI